MSSAHEIRSALRAASLARRDAILPEARHERSDRIQRQVYDYLRAVNARSVHVYLNFRSEVETSNLIDYLFQSNIDVAVPVILPDGSTDRLMQSRLTDLSALRPGRFGILEPIAEDIVPVSALDAACVPLSAFDERGNRLGYGRGYYDRFLASARGMVLVVGVAFETQLVEDIPSEEHDVPMDIVITESRVIDCKANRSISHR